MASTIYSDQKPKIIVFHPALAPYRVDFFNSISKAFDASFYFNFPNVIDQEFDQDSLKKKCNFDINYLQNGVEFFGRSFRSGIVKIIKKEKPEIVLCSEYGPITFIVFIYYYFLKKKFRLYTLSDDSIENSRTRKGLRSFVRNIISKNISGVIFPSKDVCDWYYSNISNKTKTLELPIIHDDTLFRNKLAESINTANENINTYKLKDKKVLLFVGRLVKVKNLSFLINAVAQNKSSDWILVIVGEGLLKNDLKIQATNLNISEKILFVGRKENLELFSWYTIAQIFILPSTYERFGAVVNEALLGGCKVLCSNLAGASSLINEDNGRLFNPFDVKELCSCLQDFIKQSDKTTEKINHLRVNMMPFTFEQKIDTLIQNL